MDKIKYRKYREEFLVRDYADGIIVAFKAIYIDHKVANGLCNSIHDFVMTRNELFADDIVDGIDCNQYDNKDDIKNILLDSLFVVDKNKSTISGYNIDCLCAKDEIVINYHNGKVLTIQRENRFWLTICIGIMTLSLMCFTVISIIHNGKKENVYDIITPICPKDSINKTDSLHEDMTNNVSCTIVPHDDSIDEDKILQENIMFKTICEKQVCVGEVFLVTYELGGGKDFKLPYFTNFEIVEGPFASTNSFVQVINGSVFRTFTKSYQCRLKALKEGTFTIPQATARINNKIILSDTCRIVVKANKQPIKVDSIITDGDIEGQKLLKDANYYLNEADKAYNDYAVSENEKCAIVALDNYEKVLKIIDGRMIYSQKKIQYINDCIETLKDELY